MSELNDEMKEELGIPVERSLVSYTILDRQVDVSIGIGEEVPANVMQWLNGKVVHQGKAVGRDEVAIEAGRRAGFHIGQVVYTNWAPDDLDVIEREKYCIEQPTFKIVGFGFKTWGRLSANSLYAILHYYGPDEALGKETHLYGNVGVDRIHPIVMEKSVPLLHLGKTDFVIRRYAHAIPVIAKHDFYAKENMTAKIGQNYLLLFVYRRTGYGETDVRYVAVLIEESKFFDKGNIMRHVVEYVLDSATCLIYGKLNDDPSKLENWFYTKYIDYLTITDDEAQQEVSCDDSTPSQ